MRYVRSFEMGQSQLGDLTIYSRQNEDGTFTVKVEDDVLFFSHIETHSVRGIARNRALREVRRMISEHKQSKRKTKKKSSSIPTVIVRKIEKA